MAQKDASAKPATMARLREQVRRAELEIALAEAQYTTRLLKSITEADYVVDNDLSGGKWTIVSSGGSVVDMKDLTGEGVVTDLATLRKRSYKAWRLDPHARGILRNLLKYVVGRDLSLDYGDAQRGVWVDREKTGVKKTDSDKDSLLVRLIWDDFVERNGWKLRLKELVRRTLRDGDMLLRRFRAKGRVTVRFIEPDHIRSTKEISKVTVEDVEQNPGVLFGDDVGEPTVIKDGIERLERDVETVVAYHLDVRGDGSKTERIPAADVVHLKCGADMNDARGVPFLEPILKKLAQYDTWEEYRIILNKVRTAIALVRKVEGATSIQAANLVAGRQPSPDAPLGRDPVTTSGRREAAFRAGTILTPSAGVTYDFISPRLDARDAGEDGRKILLTVASGAGMPEMLVTSDYSNANFSSTSVAAKMVQGEWEDWQDFFEPAFFRVYRWVVTEAIDGKDGNLGLPPETSLGLVIKWPTFVRDEAAKETDRRAILWQSGVISKRTWAAEEGYIYDDELEAMRLEAEMAPELGPNLGLPGALGQGPRDEKDTQEAQVNEALVALRDLEEAVGQDPESPVSASVRGYIARARSFLSAMPPHPVPEAETARALLQAIGAAENVTQTRTLLEQCARSLETLSASQPGLRDLREKVEALASREVVTHEDLKGLGDALGTRLSDLARPRKRTIRLKRDPKTHLTHEAEIEEEVQR